MTRDYETASRPMGLEYGGGGPIIRVGHKVVGGLDIEVKDDQRTLCGYACVWARPMFHLGRFMVFAKGAFDNHLARRPSIEFWLDHDETKAVGSTGKGDLELYSDDIGLAFRLRIPDTTLGRTVRYLAESREYTGMSVGCRYSSKNKQTIEGEEVTVVDDALLEEISFVKQGAVKDAFATLLDSDQSLRELCVSRIDYEQKCILFLRALRAWEEQSKG